MAKLNFSVYSRGPVTTASGASRGSQLAGDPGVLRSLGRPGEAAVEGGVQHFAQVPGRHQLQLGAHVGGDVLQVLLVASGEDDALHPGPVGRQDLVFDAAHLGFQTKQHAQGVRQCGTAWTDASLNVFLILSNVNFFF